VKRKKKQSTVNYNEWEKIVPGTIKADSLWQMATYRLALFLADLTGEEGEE